MYYQKKVDRRRKQAMVAFLINHYRYATGNGLGHNPAASYAHCVKLRRLGLTNVQFDKAWEILAADDWWNEIRDPIDDFTASMNGEWTIGTNGRSGGYLVLYDSHYETTGHKSRCRTCGQLNFKSVANLPADPNEAVITTEILRNGGCWADESYLGQSAVTALNLAAEDKLAIIRRLKPALKDATLGNKCGRCGAEGEMGRANLTRPVKRLAVSSKGIDMDRDFEDWSMGALRNRVDIVCAFDRACDEIRDNFIALTENCKVVEETIMVPKTVHRLACASA